MVEIIINAFKKININKYKINVDKVESIELFFIKKQLDMNRRKDVTHYKVIVYRDFEENNKKYTGSANVDIYPTMRADEIEEALKDGLYAAGFVKNQFYPLVAGEKSQCITLPSKFDSCSLEEAVIQIKEALYGNDIYEEGGVNSSEIFLNKTTSRIINSEGVDISFVKYTSEIECITQWLEEQDVELFNVFRYSDLDATLISEDVKDAIELTKWRVKARNSVKTGNYRVLLRKAALKSFFDYYVDNATASSVYNKLSKFKVEESVQGSSIKGDKVNITLMGSVPYDEDGFKLDEVKIIDEGILKAFYGSKRFCHYLDIKPTGVLDLVKVNLGNKTEEEMKKESYLELLAFSDFQMDSLTGDYAGEIRLGFLYDGEKVTPITGGSMSGNISDVHENMFFSKEEYKEEKFVGPKILELLNVNVSGEEI
jgi:predicted Zn-dependent protease